jgi:kumamolisin
MVDDLVELAGSDRPAKVDATRVSDAAANDQITVTVTVRGGSLPATLAAEPLSRDALEVQYGASQGDLDTVKSELEAHGLSVSDESVVGRSLHATGTVAQMEETFGVKLGVYRNDDQGDFRGREGKVMVPASLAGIVTGVFGLDERRVARRHQTDSVATAAPVRPEDLAAMYSFPDGDGSGQVVAIAEFGGAYFPDDLSQFCSKYGIQPPSVTPVSAGAPLMTPAQINALPANERQDQLEASGEVMMDIEIVAGLCPKATINVYFGQFTQQGWVDLLNTVIAATPAPSALSISWGLAEDAPDWSQAALTEINQRLQAVAALGITACAASGDDGSGDQMNDNQFHVNFPATSPYVLSVGGTMYQNDPTQQVVWWNAPGQRPQGGSTGGGVSVLFPRPAWQNVNVKSLNTDAIDGRVVPDIAALAGPPYYDLIMQGQDSPSGGTSAATPVWASLITRLWATAASHRFAAPLLYAQGPDGNPIGTSGCHDITTGNNKSPQPGTGYKAGPGFDAVSGWGTPNGTALQKLL